MAQVHPQIYESSQSENGVHFLAPSIHVPKQQQLNGPPPRETPTNFKNVERFLRFTNYQRGFIAGFVSNKVAEL